MSDITDPTPEPETPWEFLPDDEVREELPRERLPPAEADAMHVETRPPGLDPDVDLSVGGPTEPPPDVVHYFADEHPEVPDLSEPPASTDETPEVEELLIRQHYLPEEEVDEAEADDAGVDDAETEE